MTNVDCHYSIWGLLAFVILVMIISVILNIAHCIEAKNRKGKMYYQEYEYSPSYDDYYTAECPVYGNLSQDILDESCYEQMKGQPQRTSKDVKNPGRLISESQMCYASLDHSIKGKHRKPRKKKEPSLEVEEEQNTADSTLASKTSIYLNSEQLSAEKKVAEEDIHYDPIRLFGLIHATRDTEFEMEKNLNE
uniref:T cell receptor associated transmembrane adaptor 1 n=1 Tax=Sphenodon punctatus TaxID=8508 RepID=A0A8D0LCL2_SPHPU